MNPGDTGDTDDGWDDYLQCFHRERPGITERILSHSVDETGGTAYDWVASALPPTGLVVDVACGSAPLWHGALAGRYLGVDVSAAELELARARGADRLVPASAGDVPAGDHSAAAVVCSMALMILPDIDRVLEEVHRVLSPGGVFLATMPTSPRRLEHLTASAGLVRAVGGLLGYRNDARLRRPDALFLAHGLHILEDRRRTYLFDLTAPHAAEQMAASLYIRPPDPHRQDQAARFFERMASRGRGMPIPIRRILATPTDASE